MFYEWLNWLFGVALEIDGHLNLLSTDTVRLATNVYHIKKEGSQIMKIQEPDKYFCPQCGQEIEI